MVMNLLGNGGVPCRIAKDTGGMLAGKCGCTRRPPARTGAERLKEFVTGIVVLAFLVALIVALFAAPSYFASH